MSEHGTLLNRASTVPPGYEANPEPPLLEHMPGASFYYIWHGERIHYRQLGDGPPLVLIHTPDVGASCVEWRRNIEALSVAYSVFAPDLPGYGLSEVRRRPYTAELFVRFISDFLRDLTETPTRAVGSVLGASYLLHVADRWPNLVDRLMLIAPAGLSAYLPNPLRGMVFQILRLPILSSAFYNTATSRFTILEHLQHEVYSDDRLADPVVDTRYWVCHRPNATFVERSRLAGLLNTDIRAAARRVRKPIMLVWGRHETNPPLADAEVFRQLNPDAMVTVFERSGLFPHEEEPNRFNQAALNFMGLEVFETAVHA